MNNSDNGTGPVRGGKFLARTWRVVRWPLGILFVLYAGLVLWRIPAVGQKEKSEAAVAAIRAQKLTMNDVDGKHLPPPPDPALADATVEGVDANGNGIRDDVELEIFRRYPDSPKIRAAELQYAMTRQHFLTKVMDGESWVAATQQEERAYGCIFDNGDGKITTTEKYASEIDEVVFNTSSRKEALEKAERYQRSFSVPGGNDCDVTY